MVNLVPERILRRSASFLPANVRSLAKNVFFKDRHWAHPDLKKFGTIQDLYYWVSDGSKDTLLLLQNYYSALYPTVDTQTKGTVNIYDKDGLPLAEKSFSLARCGTSKFRVSSLLAEAGVTAVEGFGTLEVNLAIPDEVMDQIQDTRSFYFWDRFYIGYTSSLGQTCFVHGVDRTHIYREGIQDPIDWTRSPGGHQWAPEIPVNMEDYQKFSVILTNRTSGSAHTTLTLSDNEDRFLSWEADIPAKGVRRFELDQDVIAGLDPNEMRLRVDGMATLFGRPVVFKEFSNGAMSAMHC